MPLQLYPFGLVSLSLFPSLLTGVVNSTLTLGLMLGLAAIAQEAGFFRWAALWVMQGQRGWLFLWGALTVAITLGWGSLVTVLVLTPMMVEVLLGVGASAEVTLVLALGTQILANAASLMVTTSNWANLAIADTLGISFGGYALVMVPVSGVAIATTIAVLSFYFQQYWPGIPTTISPLNSPAKVLPRPKLVRWIIGIGCAVLVGYGWAGHGQFPTALIAGLGWLVLSFIARRHAAPKRLSPDETTTDLIRWRSRPKLPWLILAAWQPIALNLGLGLLGLSLSQTDLATLYAQQLTNLSHWGLSLTIFGSGFFAAFASTLVGTLPIGLFHSLALPTILGSDLVIQPALIYAPLIGAVLGGLISPWGTVAGWVWWRLWQRRGLGLHWQQYFQTMFLITLPVLFLTLLSLALWLPWVTVP